MKTIAVIQANLEVTPLGTRSRLADDMLAAPVLRRTAERVARATQLDEVFILCPAAQKERCEALVEGTPARVQPFNADPPPWARLVQTARKWSLDSWRGGIGGSTCFDEYFDGRLVAGLLDQHPADAVLVVAPGAVAFDPDLADRMIAHARSTKEESRLTFAQTPPGLSGLLLRSELVREVAQQGIPVGWVFSYKPDQPLKDLVFQPCFYEVPPEVRYASGRLTADTDRTWARLEALLSTFPDPDARTTGRWLIEREANHVDALPREVEIELTTDNPFPDSVLRPRGDRLGRTGLMQPELIEKVAQSLSRFDDSLLVLGGFGDPLCHPDFADILSLIRTPLLKSGGVHPEAQKARADGTDQTDAAVAHGGARSRAARPWCSSETRPAPPAAGQTVPPDRMSVGTSEMQNGGGIFGLCIRTMALDLDETRIATLLEHEVDVLSVILDAWTPQLYDQLHGQLRGQVCHEASASEAAVSIKKRRQSTIDNRQSTMQTGVSGGCHEFVLANLDRLAEVRVARRLVKPVVVPEFTKARENVHEIDDFHDGWLRKLGAVCITGASNYAGQTDDHRVMSMAPPRREACRRLQSRCLVLADGRVTLCDQDFRGRQIIGDLRNQTLEEIWGGSPMTMIRRGHHEGRFDINPLCAACDEWHRP